MNIFRFNASKLKPGPKSKSAKFKLKLMDDEGSDASDKKEGKVNGEEKKEDTGKKKVQVSKQKKEGLLDIDIDKDGEEDNEDEEEEDGIKKKTKDGGISLNEKLKKHLLMSSDEEADEEDQKGMYHLYCIAVLLQDFVDLRIIISMI